MTSTTTEVQRDPLSPTGSFNCAALASGRRFDATEFVAMAGPLGGLQQEAGYIWGTVRDDDATLYSVMRRIAPSPLATDSAGRKSLGGKLIILSAQPGADGMEMRREPRGAVDSADIAGTMQGDNTACFASSPAAAGNTMRLVLGKGRLLLSRGQRHRRRRAAGRPAAAVVPTRSDGVAAVHNPDLAGRR